MRRFKWFFKLYFAYYTELLHRYCFDNIYLHSSHRDYTEWNWKKQYITSFLNFLVSTLPNFRDLLREGKPLIIRAYRQKRLSPFFFHLFFKIKERNYQRYK